MFSVEEILKFIETIDEQLDKNKEMMDKYTGKDFISDGNLLTAQMLTNSLMIARKNWTDMLWYEYGIFYI